MNPVKILEDRDIETSDIALENFYERSRRLPDMTLQTYKSESDADDTMKILSQSSSHR